MGSFFEMKLWEKPFIQVSSGKKTIELRLYDFKRRCLNVSDYIIFSKMFFGEPKIAVKIIALHIYPSFEDLFNEFPVSDCGFEEGTTVETALEEMKQYSKFSSFFRYKTIHNIVSITNTNSKVYPRINGNKDNIQSAYDLVTFLKGNEYFMNGIINGLEISRLMKRQSFYSEFALSRNRG